MVRLVHNCIHCLCTQLGLTQNTLLIHVNRLIMIDVRVINLCTAQLGVSDKSDWLRQSYFCADDIKYVLQAFNVVVFVLVYIYPFDLRNKMTSVVRARVRLCQHQQRMQLSMTMLEPNNSHCKLTFDHLQM